MSKEHPLEPQPCNSPYSDEDAKTIDEIFRLASEGFHRALAKLTSDTVAPREAVFVAIDILLASVRAGCWLELDGKGGQGIAAMIVSPSGMRSEEAISTDGDECLIDLATKWLNNCRDVLFRERADEVSNADEGSYDGD